MAYIEIPTITWNRSTPRDGLLFAVEFARIYDLFASYVVANGGNAPPYSLTQLANSNATIAGTKTFSSTIMGNLQGNVTGNITGNVTGHSSEDVQLTGNQTIAGEKVFSESISIHGAGSANMGLSITNDTTGAGFSNGLYLGIGSDEKAYIINRELTDMTIYTNNTERMQFAASTPQITVAANARDLVDVNGLVVADRIRETGTGAGTIREKIIAIGDWDMDSTDHVLVAHGLDKTKIITYTAMIIDDNSQYYRPLINGGGPITNITGTIFHDATYICLYRTTGEIFDDSTFNLTSFNRGYITIEYID